MDAAEQSEGPVAMKAPRTSPWRDIRDAIRGLSHDYTAGPLGRAIFLLAVPMVIEMAMESIFAVVDVFFVLGIFGALRCGRPRSTTSCSSGSPASHS